MSQTGKDCMESFLNGLIKIEIMKDQITYLLIVLVRFKVNFNFTVGRHKDNSKTIVLFSYSLM